MAPAPRSTPTLVTARLDLEPVDPRHAPEMVDVVADRALYAATKRELASREWRFVQNYADAKTEVVHAILARARAARAG